MTSRRLRLVSWYFRTVIKARVKHVGDPLEVRARFETMSRRAQKAPPYSVKRHGAMGGVPVLWVASGPVQNPEVVFYIHGGGFILGSPETHYHVVAKLCRLLKCEAVMPRYRLAPEHPFPAGLNDVLAAYEALVASGREPSRIVVMGDSAGGCLTMALIAHLNQTGQPMPRAAVPISPVLDLRGVSDSIRDNAAKEAVLVAERFQELMDMYLEDHSREDPLASPYLADFAALPPTHFHVSADEILRDDTLNMVDKLKAAGHAVTVRMWDTSFHVFHLMRGYVPDADAALRDIAEFIRGLRRSADS